MNIRVPRELIYNTSLGTKRIIAYSSISFYSLKSNTCSVNELAEFCGYAADNHTSSIQKTFLNLCAQFDKAGYINIKRQKGKSLTFSCHIPAKYYGIISQSEFDRLVTYRQKAKGCINHANILLLLSYLRANMTRQPGKPVFYSAMYKTITEKTGLSQRSITGALKVLEHLNIIHTETLPRFQDENAAWHTNVKIFINMEDTQQPEYNWRRELQKAIQIVSVRQTITGG